ncbi:cell division protein ZapE [Permianibacter sp. IMCC34836]|uniref:cell division protein ZapE n=1 Tax=Permianibacter fluminis TaxID=2738515 RepID=UPI001555048E|nr:cell division protein ZapE [Permianibacter fluminis]NQD39040.1 cell division protein ZapE [Permianibacter fluminis]
MAQSPLLQRYRDDVASGRRQQDGAQEKALQTLASVQKDLLRQQNSSPGLWQRLLARKPAPVRGLYMWGGVGRGKTYLMDLFFETLPFEHKQRLHFHRFMHWLHGELKRRKGEANPLAAIGAELAGKTRVLCFDEFFVTDIGDAMLLAGLLESVFSQGLTLVATSNIPPQDLYRNGLARDNFLPAIALIEQHCQVMNVDGGTDYRLRDLQQHGVYLCPDDSAAEAVLQQRFQSLCGHEYRTEPLVINDRAIHARRWGEGVAWFDFAALCESARAQADYIELARLFHTVLVSQVPALAAGKDDAARRFISLVDEFYERRVKLTLAAAVPLERIYGGDLLAFPFERTRSRLQEMQTAAYLSAAHLP